MIYQRHPLDIGPLVFGLVFLGIVAAWGLFELGVISGADTAWILPIVLIGAGALGVVLALTKPRRAEARQEALRAYASQWTPAGHAEQTATTDVRADDTGTYTDTGTYADTYPDTDTHTYTDTYPDLSTDETVETDTPERRDD